MSNRSEESSEIEQTAKGSRVGVYPLVSFLFRPHRELLCDAMKEVQEFSSRRQLIEKLQSDLDRYSSGKYDCNEIGISKYGRGIDERIGWDTYIVTLPGYGVLGFTNGPVEN